MFNDGLDITNDQQKYYQTIRGSNLDLNLYKKNTASLRKMF